MYSTIGVERVGLCLTCINSANCIYRARRDFDAICCEMFCIEADPAKQNKNSAMERLDLIESVNKYPASPKGLCFNCENRDNCMLLIPEEGVWHCEEYI